MESRFISLEWPELNVKVQAKLADDKNPTLCNFLWENLPIHLLQSHAMVSGDTMYAFHNLTKEIPAEYVEDYTDERYWGHVPAHVGCVRFATTGYQVLTIQWGPERTEYERRVPVAYVLPENLDRLAFVGQAVLAGMSTGQIYTLYVKRTSNA